MLIHYPSLYWAQPLTSWQLFGKIILPYQIDILTDDTYKGEQKRERSQLI